MVVTPVWFMVQVANPPVTVVLLWHTEQSPMMGICFTEAEVLDLIGVPDVFVKLPAVAP